MLQGWGAIQPTIMEFRLSCLWFEDTELKNRKHIFCGRCGVSHKWGLINHFLRIGRLDIEFGVVPYSVQWSPLPHTMALGERCFGGRTEEGGVKLGVQVEGVRDQRVPSRVQRDMQATVGQTQEK